MSTEFAVKSLTDSVDSLIDLYNRWESDPRSEMQPPDQLRDMAVEISQTAASSNIPYECMPLVSAVDSFAQQADLYVEGVAIRPDRCPTSDYWKAWREVTASREQLRVQLQPRKQLETVATLLAQGVGHTQIAHHIYGAAGKGPFIGRNGIVDSEAIEREAAEPGSVVPAGWRPGQPWTVEQNVDTGRHPKESRNDDDPPQADDEQVKSRVLELSDSGKGASDIVQALSADGISITVQKVGGIIRSAKSAASA